ncbi:MAG: restriction endonuclease subunit S, partial [Paludibacteraceae bacterium]|nr:restriction endonuclease subunit S [Paludibacteraceae bacterium]
MYKSHYENVPFEIPGSWCWCTLSDLCIFLSRGKSPKYSEERLFPVFAQKCNLKDGGISLGQARFLDPSTIGKWGEDYKLKSGDVLVNSTGTGTVGRTRLFDECCLGEYPFVVPDSHISVVRTVAEIDSFYIWAILSSNWGQQYLEDNLAGSTNQKELYIGVLEDMLIPLPPKNEQKKIAKEIARCEKYVDNIDVVKAELSNYVKQTKSKILDLAISGKLVPQDPNDEPAIEILRRINPDFQSCDNSHYGNLPQGWT